MSNGTKVGLLAGLVLAGSIGAYYGFGPATTEADDAGATVDTQPHAQAKPATAEANRPATAVGLTIPDMPDTDLKLDGFGDPLEAESTKAARPADASTDEQAAPVATTQPSTQPAAPPATQPATVLKIDPPDDAPPTPRPDDPPVIGTQHEPDRLIMGDPAEELQTHIVQANESMWTIARKTLGAGHKWELIAKANPQINPDRIKPGDKLIIPKLAAERGPVAEKTPTDPLGLGFDDKAKTVTVQDGESLWKIAEREYGNGLKWRFIYTANRDKLKSPDAVRAGMRLVVPPLPRD